MQKWEYTRIEFYHTTKGYLHDKTYVKKIGDERIDSKNPLLDNYLRELGSQGWELVGITPNNVLYFKHPIEE